MSTMIHPLADVQSQSIGAGTRVWQFVVVLPEAVIGKDCNICANALIENRVVVGDRVTIKSGVQLWDGVQLEDDIFVGPNVTFANEFVQLLEASFDQNYRYSAEKSDREILTDVLIERHG